MRVGLVCPYDWNAPGGVGNHVAELAIALRANGHDVSVLSPAEDEDALPPYVVSAGRPLAVSYNGSVARVAIGPRVTRRVRRWLREGEFDVLHVHEPVSPSISPVAIWAARGPIVATWHSALLRSRALLSMSWLAQSVLEKVSGRIAVSESARSTLVDHLGGDAVLIPNGVDCDRLARALPLPGWSGESPTLFFIGRMDEPRKGLDVLLDAMTLITKHVPGTRLLIAGSGTPRPPMEGVTYLGLVSDDDKASAFHSAHVYVAPHTGGESFGIVLAEAMSAGTAVLASDLDSFRRVLDDGRAGELFRVGDSVDLAERAAALLLDDPRRDALALAGQSFASQFDWSVVVRKVEEVYASVTVGGGRVQEDLRGQLVGRLSRRGVG